MTVVEFTAKGGNQLFARAEAVHAWTQSLENPDWARVWIGGRQYETEQTVAQVTKIIVEAR